MRITQVNDFQMDRERGADIKPILHTAWIDNHALTQKINTAKYYLGEKSRTLVWSNYHTYVEKKRENLYGCGTITCKTTIPKPLA